jgi:uncharacterized membrane protein YphA (DoxX/SURF4 family)
MPHKTPGGHLAALLLRITLGVIFVYHGVDKVSGNKNDLGASWATNMWKRAARAPQDVVDKLEGIHDVDRDTLKLVVGELGTAYARETAEMPDTLNSHAGQLAVAWGELLGGIALLLGLLTRVAAFGLAIIQIGAIATVTGFRGFSLAGGGGYEYNLALLAMCFALVLMGPGMIAVDRLVLPRNRHVPAEKPLAGVTS